MNTSIPQPLLKGKNYLRISSKQIKSIDVFAKRFMEPEGILKFVRKEAENLAGFGAEHEEQLIGNVRIRPDAVSKRQLMIVFEHGAATRQQINELTKAGKEIMAKYGNDFQYIVMDLP